MKGIKSASQRKQDLNLIVQERKDLSMALKKLSFVSRVYPSDSNFLLVKVDDAKRRYQELLQKGVVVRDRSSEPLCANCLRISVGTPKENKILLNVLKQLQ